MKLLAISDLHGYTDPFTEQIRQVDADVMINSGDLTANGSGDELYAFVKWFASFKHIRHKLFTGGNHDKHIQQINSRQSEYLRFIRYCDDLGVTYMHNRTIFIDGLCFYGSSYSPAYGSWFNQYREDQADAIWSLIPPITDVLITHTPAYLIRDQTGPKYGCVHAGCKSLRNVVDKLPSLLLHVYGHIHYSSGTEIIKRSSNLQSFISANAALLNEDNLPEFKPAEILITT